MKNAIISFLIIQLSTFAVSEMFAQDILSKKWTDIATKQPEQWYTTDEASSIADSVMKYQMPNGGWPKNQQWHIGADQAYMQKCRKEGVGSTFDNKATTTEMRFLCKMYGARKDENYRKAFMHGLEYIFSAQYTNGGWPQFFPARKGHSVAYSSHITFNDGVMVNILKLLRDIARDTPEFRKLNLPQTIKDKAENSYQRGIRCILDCQVKRDGQLTVWCQQHDEHTLEPAPARAYELKSLSGHGETVDILLLLMDIDNPSDSIKESIISGVEWLKKHAIKDTAIEKYTNADGNKDIRTVYKKDAPPIWARFYSLETGRPIFCDRDGKVKYTIEEIGYERRNGYSWYGTSPQKAIKRYNEWLKENDIPE